MADKVKSRSKKNLNKSEIKNSKNNILHSINHVRANEKKVMAILVGVFIILFVVLGYFTLTIDSSNLMSEVKKSANNIIGISVSTSSITLDSDDVMDDESGLQSKAVTLSINNEYPDSYSYRVFLEEDDYLKKQCECEKTIDKSSLRYSLDGINVKTFDEDMLIDIGSVDSLSGKDINVRIWVDKDASLDDETHFHGTLKIEQCSLE
jgi:preprotein translocase subunit SecG